MKRIMIAATAVLAVATTALAFHDQGGRRFREFLSGLKEAPQIVVTSATGTFKATINKEGTEIDYELTFKDLESDVRQAHIHLGWPQSNGGIVLWLCDSATNNSPIGTTPLCAPNPADAKDGVVTGTLTAADVVPSVPNGIAGTADEWADVLALLRSGRTYVNVHTATITAGEIRSQIDNGDDDRDDHGRRDH